MSNDRTNALSSEPTRSAARPAVETNPRAMARRCRRRRAGGRRGAHGRDDGRTRRPVSKRPAVRQASRDRVAHRDPQGREEGEHPARHAPIDRYASAHDDALRPRRQRGQHAPGTPGAVYDCGAQTVRAIRVLPSQPLPATPGQALPDPFPAPTLRARVGGLVQLTFVNQIDPARFPLTSESSGNSAACDVVVGVYPGPDKYPDCFHGSSTGNIHFHGTHTNPNGTADNVLLELRPSPRDANKRPTIGPDTYKKQFDAFFAECAAQLAAIRPPSGRRTGTARTIPAAPRSAPGPRPAPGRRRR